MSKPNFIRDIIAGSLPPVEKVEAGVRYAERVWDELTRLGYGSPKQQKPRETKNWYNELTDRQRQWLDKFREEFGLKYSPRNRTALSWHKLGEQTDDEYKRIIAAGRNEATLRLTRDTTPPYAELWINEGRYADFVVSERRQNEANNSQRKRELKADLNHYKLLQQKVPDQADQLEPEIKKLEAQVEALSE